LETRGEKTMNMDEIQSKLKVLEEIKQLVSDRLGEKIKPKEVSLEIEAEPKEEECGMMSEDDEKELEMLRSKMG
jgi:hypothetical protein